MKSNLSKFLKLRIIKLSLEYAGLKRRSGKHKLTEKEVKTLNILLGRKREIESVYYKIVNKMIHAGHGVPDTNVDLNYWIKKEETEIKRIKETQKKHREKEGGK